MDRHRENTNMGSASDNRRRSTDFAIPDEARRERQNRNRRAQAEITLPRLAIQKRLEIIQKPLEDGQTSLYHAQEVMKVLFVEYYRDYEADPNQHTKRFPEGTQKFLNTLNSLGEHLARRNTNEAIQEYANLKKQADNPVVDEIRTVWQDLHHMHEEEKTFDNKGWEIVSEHPDAFPRVISVKPWKDSPEPITVNEYDEHGQFKALGDLGKLIRLYTAKDFENGTLQDIEQALSNLEGGRNLK